MLPSNAHYSDYYIRYGIGSLHAGGTVDAEDLSVDPLAILGSQEADDTGNIDRETDTVHGGPAGGVLIDTFIVELSATGDVLAANITEW